MAVTRVVFENEAYVGESLTDEEMKILTDQVFNIIAKDSDVLTSLYRDNQAKILGAAEVAKHELAAVFRGISAGDGEIGLNSIRAGYIKRSTSSTETPDWDWTFAFAAGNDNWIGYDTNNATAVNIDSRLLVLWLAVMWTSGNSPVVEDLQFQIGGTTYPMESVRGAWVADNNNNIRIARIRPKMLPPKSTLLVSSRETNAGTNELVAIGLAFGTGAFLRLAAPTTVQV
jgi:hypothetical protein